MQIDRAKQQTGGSLIDRGLQCIDIVCGNMGKARHHRSVSFMQIRNPAGGSANGSSTMIATNQRNRAKGVLFPTTRESNRSLDSEVGRFAKDSGFGQNRTGSIDQVSQSDEEGIIAVLDGFRGAVGVAQIGLGDIGDCLDDRFGSESQNAGASGDRIDDLQIIRTSKCPCTAQSDWLPIDCLVDRIAHLSILLQSTKGKKKESRLANDRFAITLKILGKPICVSRYRRRWS